MASNLKKELTIGIHLIKHKNPMVMCCMDMHYLPGRGGSPM